MKNLSILIKDGKRKLKDQKSILDIALRLNRLNAEDLLFIII